jgi:hypothetical protein
MIIRLCENHVQRDTQVLRRRAGMRRKMNDSYQNMNVIIRVRGIVVAVMRPSGLIMR